MKKYFIFVIIFGSILSGATIAIVYSQNLASILFETKQVHFAKVLTKGVDYAANERFINNREKLTKPTPLPLAGKTQKKIEIVISEQKMYLWQDGKIISEHIISTGKMATPTKIGNFSVLTKQEVAYGCGTSQCWKMPYWLGVYKVNGSENGIHELPFIKVGNKYYRENPKSLGRRVSHGCIRVAVGEAKIIYDWAELAMPVTIRK